MLLPIQQQHETVICHLVTEEDRLSYFCIMMTTEEERWTNSVDWTKKRIPLKRFDPLSILVILWGQKCHNYSQERWKQLLGIYVGITGSSCWWWHWKWYSRQWKRTCLFPLNKKPQYIENALGHIKTRQITGTVMSWVCGSKVATVQQGKL